MAVLLADADEDQVGTGAAMSGPCTVYVRGNFAGAKVAIQIADEDVAASYVRADKGVLRESHIDAPGAITCNAMGDYYIRAILQGAIAGATEVSAVALQ